GVERRLPPDAAHRRPRRGADPALLGTRDRAPAGAPRGPGRRPRLPVRRPPRPGGQGDDGRRPRPASCRRPRAAGPDRRRSRLGALGLADGRRPAVRLRPPGGAAMSALVRRLAALGVAVAAYGWQDRLRGLPGPQVPLVLPLREAGHQASLSLVAL